MDHGMDFLEGVDLTKLYEEHNPSREPTDIVLKDGFVAIIRFPEPGEETRGGVILPTKDGEKYGYQPNCSRIVATKGVKRKDIVPGRYAFWVFSASADDTSRVKPQPLVYQYGDTMAVIWVIHEDEILGTVPHAGDPAWLEYDYEDLALDEDGDHYVEIQSAATGKWLRVDPAAIVAGEVFRLTEDGPEYRAAGPASGQEKDDGRGGVDVVGPWKVFCAPLK